MLVDRTYTQADLQQARVRLRKNVEAGNYPYSVDDEVDAVLAYVNKRADSGIVRKGWKGESRAGLYVESPELTAQLLAYMIEGIPPENSHQLVLDEDGDLQWITQIDGGEVRFDTDPLSSFGQRIMSSFIGILPVESQL